MPHFGAYSVCASDEKCLHESLTHCLMEINRINYEEQEKMKEKKKDKKKEEKKKKRKKRRRRY